MPKAPSTGPSPFSNAAAETVRAPRAGIVNTASPLAALPSSTPRTVACASDWPGLTSRNMLTWRALSPGVEDRHPVAAGCRRRDIVHAGEEAGHADVREHLDVAFGGEFQAPIAVACTDAAD